MTKKPATTSRRFKARIRCVERNPACRIDFSNAYLSEECELHGCLAYPDSGCPDCRKEAGNV